MNQLSNHIGEKCVRDERVKKPFQTVEMFSPSVVNIVGAVRGIQTDFVRSTTDQFTDLYVCFAERVFMCIGKNFSQRRCVARNNTTQPAGFTFRLWFRQRRIDQSPRKGEVVYSMLFFACLFVCFLDNHFPIKVVQAQKGVASRRQHIFPRVIR